MKLFTPDLYRNFGIGFVAGALVVGFAKGGTLFETLPQLLAKIA